MDTSSNFPFETSAMVGRSCICLGVQRASRVIGRRFDEALRPVGLNNWQFSLMMALHRPEATSVGKLAERLAMDRTTITTNLKPLERRGLVETRPDPQDGRVRRVSLTDAGRSLLAEALVHWQTVNDAVVASLGDGNVPAFQEALRQIRQG